MTRLALLTCLAFSLSAFAGKPERDKQKELQPKIDASTAAAKAACGCAVKISVKWDTYKTADDMHQVGYVMDAIDAAVKAQCQSPEDKKALCSNVTTIELAYAAECDVTAKGKTVTCTTNKDQSCGDHQFKAVFEKF